MEREIYVPNDVAEEAKSATFELLPPKSKVKYEKEYKNFKSWQNSRQIRGTNEDIMLSYFHGIGNVQKASSLWTRYSMLKSTLKVNENIDIGRYVNKVFKKFRKKITHYITDFQS